MSLEAAIYSILSGSATITSLVGGARAPRISPIHRSQGKGVPAIVYQQISSGDEVTCDGHIDPRTDRIQIVSWDDDPAGARTLAEAVRSAMTSASGSHGGVTVRYCSFEDESDQFDLNDNAEAETVYGKRQDWQVCYEA